MASSVVQSNANSGAATSLTVVLGAAPTAGNTLLAIMASDTTHAGVPTAGAGNSYTQRLAQVGGQGFYVWTRLVAGGESATTTFTPSTADPAGLVVAEIQGTFDKVGAGTTITGSALATRDTTTLSPTTTDRQARLGQEAVWTTPSRSSGRSSALAGLRLALSPGGKPPVRSGQPAQRRCHGRITTKTATASRSHSPASAVRLRRNPICTS
jgi:hypothetical protein